MKMVALSHLAPGMRLAKSVFGADGRILLKKSVEVSSYYIARLREKGFTYLYIEDQYSAGIEDVDSIPDELRQEVVSRLQTVFRDGDFHHNIKSGKLGKEFTSIYRLLFTHLQQNAHMMVTLSAIYSSDAYTYTHCMNVATIATVLGLAHGYSNDEVEQLGVGAMLHDIGKVEISPSIINKPSHLTDAERREMQKHCQFGYDILRLQSDLPDASAICALTHHEHLAGSGYPLGLSGDKIPVYGRLLAVPDVFDAMTANRNYRAALLPSDVLEYIYARTYTQFDPYFVQLFVHHVNIYPVGLPVQLSNGLVGVVSRPNGGNIQRPVILVTEDCDGEASAPYELDLSTHLNITITKCLV